MKYKTIAIEIHDQVAVLMIDRAPVNAVNLAVINEIDLVLDAFEKNKEVRCIIITGAGEKAFSAGLDIKDANNINAAGVRGQVVWARLFRFSKPVIAAINGFAFGGGCELAMACHFRIMADHPKAKIGLTELDIGIIPGWGGTQFLPRLVGRKKAMELILLGKRLTSAEALETGLVDKTCAPEKLMEEAFALAGKLAKRAPVAVSCALKAIHTGMEEGLEEGLRVEQEGSRVVGQSHDAKEGFSAFFEKREPVFKGE